jgi:hypothetical protein
MIIKTKLKRNNMIQFFNFKFDGNHVILVGDIKWKTSKYTLVKNLYKVPIFILEIPFHNYELSKKTSWSVLSNTGYKEYKATSLIDALFFMFGFKKNKKAPINILKRNNVN